MIQTVALEEIRGKNPVGMFPAAIYLVTSLAGIHDSGRELLQRWCTIKPTWAKGHRLYDYRSCTHPTILFFDFHAHFKYIDFNMFFVRWWCCWSSIT
jgi:hypothetical protein